MLAKTRSLPVPLMLLVACGGDNPAGPLPNGGADSTTVVLDASKDNTLIEDSTGALSNGAGDFLFAGTTNQPGIRRATLRFDVASSPIPTGATIDSAVLTLYMSKTVAGSATVTLHRLTANWGEADSNADGAEGDGAAAHAGDATWIHTFSDTSMWTNAGGDFVASPSASTVVQSTGFYHWRSTEALLSDIRSWLDNPAGNFGWILIGDESMPVTSKRFDSREHPEVTHRPKLTVFFTR
jgi:hypothetical protein